jgi:hypothetical protein
MPRIIQGDWDELVSREDLRGHSVRVIVLDQDHDNSWLKSLQAWADSHQPLGHPVDDTREGICSGTVDDPR